MNSNNTKKQKQAIKQDKNKPKNKPPVKMTPKEKAAFSDMNQIDWYPVDPYND